MSTRVYIGRLSYHVTEKDIAHFFEGYGKIREILIKNGFGFVEFDHIKDAEDAVSDLNGKELLGDKVTIEHARGSPRGNDMYRDRSRGYRAPLSSRRRQGGGGGRDKRYGPPTRTEYRLIVENLSSRVSWQDLKDYMRQAGEVTYADAHKQRRNEGVVEFASYSDMKTALDKLDDTDLSGRRIRLSEDRSRRRRSSRSRSRSRSRSHSRSRSRSRSRRNRSRSRSKSHSISKSRSRSKSRTPSRSKSRSRSKSVSKGRSNRSTSRKQSRSRSRSVSGERKERKSRSRSKSHKSMSRSRSPRSRSKSSEKRSASPIPKDEVSNSAEDKS